MIRQTFRLLCGVRTCMAPMQFNNQGKCFQSTLQQKKEADKQQLFEKMNSLFEAYKTDKSNLSDLQMMAKQLNSYLGEINVHQYENFTKVSIQANLVDQSTAKKLLERGYYFYDTKQIKIGQFLFIVNSILQFNHTLEQKQLSLIVDLVDKIDYKNIVPDNLPDCAAIVAKLKAFFIYEAEDLNQRVVEAIKNNYGLINVGQIGQLSVSLALLQIEDNELWDKLENYLIQEMSNTPFEEVVRSATAMIMNGDKATKYYWKTFFDHISQTIKLQTPDVITQTMLLLTQGNKTDEDVYKSIEDVFQNRYAEFDTYNSILMFACFGKLQMGEEIWKYFDEDLPGFLEQGDKLDISFMIMNILPISQQFKAQSKDLIQNYVIKNGSQFRDDIKEQIQKEFGELNIVNEDIEKALDKNRLWI